MRDILTNSFVVHVEKEHFCATEAWWRSGWSYQRANWKCMKTSAREIDLTERRTSSKIYSQDSSHVGFSTLWLFLKQHQQHHSLDVDIEPINHSYSKMYICYISAVQNSDIFAPTCCKLWFSTSTLIHNHVLRNSCQSTTSCSVL